MYMYGYTCTCELPLYFHGNKKVYDYLITCENIIVIGFLYKMTQAFNHFLQKWLIFAYMITYNYQKYKIPVRNCGLTG